MLETVQEEEEAATEAATEAGTEAAAAAGEVTTKQPEEVAVTEDNIEEIVEIEEVENVSNNEIVARVELKIASPEDNGKC